MQLTQDEMQDSLVQLKWQVHPHTWNPAVVFGQRVRTGMFCLKSRQPAMERKRNQSFFSEVNSNAFIFSIDCLGLIFHGAL